MTADAVQDARILIIDDQETEVRALESLLSEAGYGAISVATDPRQATAMFRDVRPDLVALDLHESQLTGLAVAALLQKQIPDGAYLPILMVTEDTDSDSKARAIQVGARDFVSKPFRADEVLLRVKNLLEMRFLQLQFQAYTDLLERQVSERTRDLERAQQDILKRVARAVEYRDDVTGQHAQRVGLLAAMIAERLGMPVNEVERLRHAAPLHDVGKIAVADEIILKPGPLTPAERLKMQSHSAVGAAILRGSDCDVLRMAEVISLRHHECWDGTGYPDGLQGSKIPLVARIVAVADAFDAVTHHRPYKPARSFKEGVAEIVAGRGTRFDPRIVDAFLDIIKEGWQLELAYSPESHARVC
jgi:putative two-component system response regulator